MRSALILDLVLGEGDEREEGEETEEVEEETEEAEEETEVAEEETEVAEEAGAEDDGNSVEDLGAEEVSEELRRERDSGSGSF